VRLLADPLPLTVGHPLRPSAPILGTARPWSLSWFMLASFLL
jgi:hypothetical protein